MTTLGKYEIVQEIGRGGFGVVYQARDVVLDRIVALKILHSQHNADPRFIRRFRQEASVAARLNHPHIVTVYEVGEQAGQHYLAMAFLPGRTLDKWLEQGPLPAELAVSVTEQIADALDAIHARKLVHRDVKPANIMLDDDERATLLDFGIVRAAEGTRLTSALAVLGTPQYMAPEQAELERMSEPDWRADVYALGVVAYEMLVGRPPFTGSSPTAILHKQVYEPPPAPTQLNPGLIPKIEPVLLKALAKEREARHQRAGELASELQHALLTEDQIRRRQALLDTLYESLQRAVADEDWAEVLAVGGQIKSVDRNYRDVLQLMGQARQRLRRPPRRPMPRWAWGVGAALLLVLLAGLILRAGVFQPRPTATPTLAIVSDRATATATPTGTETPAAVTSTPTPSPAPTDTPAPTLTPTGTPTPSLAPTPTPAPPTATPETPTPTPISPTPTAPHTPTPQEEAVVGEDGAELRPGAATWWFPRQILPAGTELKLLGFDPTYPDWVYVADAADPALEGWTQVANLHLHRDLDRLPRITPRPTLTATPGTPAATQVPPVGCAGGPLSLQFYADPGSERCIPGGGWSVNIHFIVAGGTCTYTYYWEGARIHGPTTDREYIYSVTWGDAALSGTGRVTSGAEERHASIYVPMPACD